jgi:hypothetical protein
MSHPELSWARALKLGFVEAVSSVPSVVFLGLCHLFEALLMLYVVGVSVVHWVLDPPRALVPGLFVVGLVWLSCRGGRILVLGGALRWGSERMASGGTPQEAWTRAFLMASGTALSFLLLDAVAKVSTASWSWAALFAAGGAYVQALKVEEHGAWASLGIAWALVLSWALGSFVDLFTQLGLVRAVVRREGVAIALFESVREWWRRPWAPIVILMVTGFAFGVLQTAASSSTRGQMVGVGDQRAAVALFGGTLGALLHAFVSALLDLTRLHAFAALELNRQGRVLPPVPPVPRASLVVPRAELVVDAARVGDIPPA